MLLSGVPVCAIVYRQISGGLLAFTSVEHYPIEKWKGGLHHEEVCQAESEMFGPAETGYQVQFLNRTVIK